MAPEVVKNEPYSAKVDIWSLGCTVIEMYTGKRPWLDMTALAAVYSVSWHSSVFIILIVTSMLTFIR
jgi:serine/threonine protein kinase